MAPAFSLIKRGSEAYHFFFFAAQGLQPFFAAQGFLAAQGLQPFFAAQGLCFAAQGLQPFLAEQGLQAASCTGLSPSCAAAAGSAAEPARTAAAPIAAMERLKRMLVDMCLSLTLSCRRDAGFLHSGRQLIRTTAKIKDADTM
jgi:hypothetical protein